MGLYLDPQTGEDINEDELATLPADRQAATGRDRPRQAETGRDRYEPEASDSKYHMKNKYGVKMTYGKYSDDMVNLLRKVKDGRAYEL